MFWRPVIVKYEVEIMWKEAVSAYFKIYQHLPGETERNRKRSVTIAGLLAGYRSRETPTMK
jgi:hypothetical protein